MRREVLPSSDKTVAPGVVEEEGEEERKKQQHFDSDSRF